MTPDPLHNPLDSAAAAPGPTPPLPPQPAPPHQPTPPDRPPAVPRPPAATAPPAVPADPPAIAAPAATPQQAAAAETVAHTGTQAPPPPGDTLVAEAVAQKDVPVPPVAAVPVPAEPSSGVAPAPGQIAAAEALVNRPDEPAKEEEGMSTAAVVGLAAAATAAVGGIAAAVVAAVTGDHEKAEPKPEEPPKSDPPEPTPTPVAPLAARMKGEQADAGTTPVAPKPNVPHVPAEGELGGEDLVKADATPEPAPRTIALPPKAGGIDIPKSAELDKELEEAISAGMGDDALSLQMNAGAAKAGAGGPKIEGTDPATGQGPGQPTGADEAVTPAPMIGDEENIEPGTKLMGKVDSKTDSDIFINLQTSRLQGIIPRTDYPDGNGPPVGFNGAFLVDRVDTENGLIHLQSPRGRRKVSGDWDSLVVGQTVECSVTGTNKGGLQVQVGKLRGFMPASQIDLGYVSDMTQYVGQRLNARVTEVKPEKKNLVLSRAAVLKEERKGLEAELWETLKPGDTRDGIVRALKPYGAFVDIGGVDGFLHIGEISHNRIGHPNEVLKDGQKIQVKILKVEPDAKKVGLGMKQLTKDPWQQIEESYPVGSTCRGKVTKCTEFGAFVEIEEGIEGLIHISELDHKRVSRVSDVVRMGEEVEAKVLTVEPNRKRVSLSLKALKEKPAGSGPKKREKKEENYDLPAYERQRKGKLLGGTGEVSGGLFGDPDEFRK